MSRGDQSLVFEGESNVVGSENIQDIRADTSRAMLNFDKANPVKYDLMVRTENDGQALDAA